MIAKYLVLINERNIIYEKVKQAGNITDTDLMRALEKEDNSVSWPDFNKRLQRTNAGMK